MKKIILTLMFLIMSFPLFAQDFTENDFNVKLYPFPLLIGKISVEGEYLFKDQFSLDFEASYLKWDIDSELLRSLNIIGEDDSWTITYLSAGPGFRYYPFGSNTTGFFTAAYADYVNVALRYRHSSGNGGSSSTSGLSVAFDAGYKKTFTNLVLEISTGISYTYLGSVSVKYENDLGSVKVAEFPFSLQGVLWSGIGLGAGFAF